MSMDNNLFLKAQSTGDTRRGQSQTERVALLSLTHKTIQVGRGAGGRGSQSLMMTPLIVRFVVNYKNFPSNTCNIK